METGEGQWRLRLTPHARPADDESLLTRALIGRTGAWRIMRFPPSGVARAGRRPSRERMMSPNKKKVMLPKSMAKAGWDVLTGRDDIEAVSYDPYLTMGELQAALADTDGIALSLTPLKEPEIAAAPRLRVAARIGVGYDAVEIPALTKRGIPLMVVGTANSVSVAEHAIFMMYALAKQVMGQDKLVRSNRWKDRW